jgi:hypothetical protein
MKPHRDGGGFSFIALGLVLVLGVLCLTPFAWAEDRALLIGVGKYQMPGNDLPGIDLDINMMEETASLMGFNVKVLMDEEATLANTQRVMNSWLREGVSADDRVLIYFSGHGVRIPDDNGDEADDNQDEVLVMHDVKQEQRNGQASLGNVLVDDQFDQLLAGIPSNNVLVLIDACHSGTSTKNLSLSPTSSFGNIAGQPKVFNYSGMPKAVVTRGNFSVEERTEKTQENYVLIAAAQDHQQAIATKQGSVFTVGVHQLVRDAAQNRQTITPKQIRDEVEDYIKTELQGSNSIFHPNLIGSENLAQKPLQLVSLQGGHGPVWTELEALAQAADNSVGVILNQESFAEGDELVIQINVSRGGYLNVVNVGPDDQHTVLFPNEFHANDNYVDPGRLTIPTERMNFTLPAGEPFGPSLVFASITDEPINLYQSGKAQRNAKGMITDTFSALSPLGMKQMRSFRVEQKAKARLAAGMVETKVCATLNGC